MQERETLRKMAGKTLREIREATGLSIFKVGKAIHISGNYLSEIERGIKEPSDVVLESLAEFYRMDCMEMFSLYDRIAPIAKSAWLKNPGVHNTMTKISLDNRLTDAEKDQLLKEITCLYEKLINNR